MYTGEDQHRNDMHYHYLLIKIENKDWLRIDFDLLNTVIVDKHGLAYSITYC